MNGGEDRVRGFVRVRRSMNVVHLLASPFIGGPERQVLGLARSLPSSYHSTFLSFPERGLSQALLDQARADFDAAIRLVPDTAEAHTGLGYVEACRGAGANARRSAQIAVLYGPGDFLILHNVACIFAKLSEGEPDRRREYEDMTIDYLRRAVELWKRDRSGPNELTLIRDESAFGKSLKARPEFKKLLED